MGIEILMGLLLLPIAAGALYALRLWLGHVLGWEDRMRKSRTKLHGRAPAGGTVCGAMAAAGGFIASVASAITCKRCQAQLGDLAKMIRRANRRRVSALLLGAVLLSATTASPLKAQSGMHGEGHAEHHDEYTTWQRPDVGGSCCNAEKPDGTGDCRPTRARVTVDGRWEAWDGRRWIVIPPSKILQHPAKDGRTHLCEKGGSIYCFTPGEIRS